MIPNHLSKKRILAVIDVENFNGNANEAATWIQGMFEDCESDANAEVSVFNSIQDIQSAADDGYGIYANTQEDGLAVPYIVSS